MRLDFDVTFDGILAMLQLDLIVHFFFVGCLHQIDNYIYNIIQIVILINQHSINLFIDLALFLSCVFSSYRGTLGPLDDASLIFISCASFPLTALYPFISFSFCSDFPSDLGCDLCCALCATFSFIPCHLHDLRFLIFAWFVAPFALTFRV